LRPPAAGAGGERSEPPLTRKEAGAALDDALRRVRLGPLYRPRMTLRELNVAYLEQYDAAESTVKWLSYNLRKAEKRFGDERISELNARQIAVWRQPLPELQRHSALRALRQVLTAAVRWKWIEENPALLVRNTAPRVGEIDPFETGDEIDAIGPELETIHGVLVEFLVGTSVRPEEAFGADWAEIELRNRIVTVQRAYAKGRLKRYAKTERSRRRLPVRARTVDALRRLDHRTGILFPNQAGERIDVNNFHSRNWTRHSRPPAFSTGASTTCGTRTRLGAWRRASTSSHCRAGDIDRTYGHLAAGADDYERNFLDAYDRRSDPDGRSVGAGSENAEEESN
jgi:integrase